MPIINHGNRRCKWCKKEFPVIEHHADKLSGDSEIAVVDYTAKVCRVERFHDIIAGRCPFCDQDNSWNLE